MSDKVGSVSELFSTFGFVPNYSQDYKSSYVVAMTPRSGSSYLCDLLTNTKICGRPGEFLPYEHIKIALDNLGVFPSVQDHTEWLVRQTSTNGVFGQKISFYQALPFIKHQDGDLLEHLFPSSSFLVLFRRNIVKQAISLYLATESKYFHSFSEQDKSGVQDVGYDKKKIRFWVDHIYSQECGWLEYLAGKSQSYMLLFYEDFLRSKEAVFKQVVSYLTGGDVSECGLPDSEVTNISSSLNQMFFEEFLSSNENLIFLRDLGVPDCRYC